jgi:circadian clock protein KaiC
MLKRTDRKNKNSGELPKSCTGIKGLDQVTLGGLPKGRPTLICGSAGCGKTLISLEFLIRGAVEYGEPGVFMSFEESVNDITANVASLGFDIEELSKKKKLTVDYVHIDRSEIEENGEYDLEGLFIRLGYAIDSIGAKRVVLDTIENLFGGIENHGILRAELRRLFRWLKDKGVTAVITGERGEGQLTRHGLEEYVSDCVILLDHRVNDQVSTRRLRIVKYRGSLHGTNEYPFLIDEHGISVIPITAANLNHSVTNERISSGIPRLDTMLGGEGFYRGSSILVSGTSGTGKSSLCAHVAKASCGRGEGVLYFAFEESEKQIVRNMRSIGVNLDDCVKNGLLKIQATRPTHYGLEMHLAIMHKRIDEDEPKLVIMDPINNLVGIGNRVEVNSMLTRLVDLLKSRGITAFFTSLTSGSSTSLEETDVGMSSLMDTWILLRDIELNGERNRGLYVLKSRGMAHSNQIREFIISKKGIDLVDVYTGSEGVLTGSARLAQEEKERVAERERKSEVQRKAALLERRRKVAMAQIAALQAELAAEELDFKKIAEFEAARTKTAQEQQMRMARKRKAD